EFEECKLSVSYHDNSYQNELYPNESYQGELHQDESCPNKLLSQVEPSTCDKANEE
ncbi:34042_t:CDS:2, partial [Racocetra persica]